MFSPGWQEMLIIGVLALLMFGKRLPEVARSLGKGVVEFKKGLRGLEDDVETAGYQRESSRPVPSEEHEYATVPKFEPPKSEPTAAD